MNIKNQKTRREFLQNLGILGSSALVVSAFPWFSSFGEAPHLGQNKARIGIIGPGSRGRYLQTFLALISECEIVALCDNYAPSLIEAVKISPKAKTFSDHRKMLEMKDLDAVVVATPLHEHLHIVLDALSAGKHVFCEKATARTPADCLKMYEAYKNSGKIFFVGHQRMFDLRYLKAIEMIRSGIFGTIQRVNTHWNRNNDWRRPVPSPELERKINWRLYKEYSAGLMTELASHQIQVGNWVYQAIPETIMGSGAITFWKDTREVYDNVSVTYTYADGKIMNFNSVVSNKFYGLEEQILGNLGTLEVEKGKYYFENLKAAPGIYQLINDVEHRLFEAIPIAGPSWIPETATDGNGEYILGKKPDNDGSSLLLNAYVQAIITNKQAPNLAEEGYYSSVMALLGEQAMDEKRIITFPDELKIDYLNHKKIVKA